jgi:hypothetical protein
VRCVSVSYQRPVSSVLGWGVSVGNILPLSFYVDGGLQEFACMPVEWNIHSPYHINEPFCLLPYLP